MGRGLRAQPQGADTIRRLQQLDPGNPQKVVAVDPSRRRDLARVLAMRAMSASGTDPEESAETAWEALRIYRELPVPHSADDQTYWASAALIVTQARLESGHLNDAYAAALDAVEQTAGCAQRAPNEFTGQQALALALLARCNELRGEVDDARIALAKATERLTRAPYAVRGRADAEKLLAELRQRLA